VSTTVMQLDSKLVDDLVNRIVTAIHPIKIVMFGSAAQGSIGPDSDIDVMVVVPDGTHCLNTAQYLYLDFGLFWCTLTSEFRRGQTGKCGLVPQTRCWYSFLAL
jgi:DNA polymerase sigma